MLESQNNLAAGIVFFLCLTVLGVWIVTFSRSQSATRNKVISLFVTALLVRFLSSLLIYEFGFTSIIGDEDSSGYFIGQFYGGTWIGYGYSLFDLPALWLPAFEEHHRGYYYLVGTLYFLTGWTGRLPPAALNCFFGAMTVVMTYKIASSLFSEWTATRVGWLVCLIPSMIIWSCQTLKEPVVIFLETLALYSCIRLRINGFSVKYVLLSVFSIFLLYPFRFYASLVAAIAVFATIMMPEIGKRTKSSWITGILLLIIVVPISISTGMVARTEAQIEEYDVKRVQQFRSDVAVGQGSGVITQYNLSTPSGFTIATIVGALHLLLAPFPWQMGGSLRLVFTFPEMIFWWWLFFFGFIPGIRYVFKWRLFETLPLLIFIILLGFLYSVTFGNVGLVFRQRAQILPLMAIFAIVGLELKQVLKLQRYPLR